MGSHVKDMSNIQDTGYVPHMQEEYNIMQSQSISEHLNANGSGSFD